MTTRKVSSLAFLGGVLPLLAISVGCGGNKTTASKGAAAYDEAQRKGAAPGTGGAHGGHGGAETSPMPAGPHAVPGQGTGAAAPTAGASPSSVDHSKMAGTDQAKAPGRGGAAMAGMDHSKMAGMDQAKAPAGGTAMKGTDHSKIAGMGGSAMARPQGTMPPPQPERPSTTAKPGQPAATLGADENDAPAPTAVSDAARSAAMAQEMSGGHGMQHGTYRQIDAGRDSVAPKREEGHEGHGAAPQPQAPPKADPHQMRSAPAAPTPAPSTRAPRITPPAAKQDRKMPPRAQPSPSPDPHQMHAAPASPRPSPTPGVKDENR